MNLLVDSTIRMSLIIASALIATTVLRRRSAAERHWIIAVAFAGAAAAPTLGAVFPAWHVDIRRAAIGAHDSAPAAAVVDMPKTPALGGPLPRDLTIEGSAATRPPARFPLIALLVAAWATGVGVSLGVVAVGLGRAAWIAARARPIEGGPWIDATRRLAAAYGIRRPVRLLLSDHPTLLVTWGFRRPNVLL